MNFLDEQELKLKKLVEYIHKKPLLESIVRYILATFPIIGIILLYTYERLVIEEKEEIDPFEKTLEWIKHTRYPEPNKDDEKHLENIHKELKNILNDSSKFNEFQVKIMEQFIQYADKIQKHEKQNYDINKLQWEWLNAFHKNTKSRERKNKAVQRNYLILSIIASIVGSVGLAYFFPQLLELFIQK